MASRGRSSELEEKLRRFSARAESGSPARILKIERTTTDAAHSDTFRSGWSRPPHVEPPLGLAENVLKAISASRRSSSLPNTPSKVSSSSTSFQDKDINAGGNLRPQVPASPFKLSFADAVAARSQSCSDHTAAAQFSARSINSQDSKSSLYSDGNMNLACFQTADMKKKLSNEGWLGKRSSGKIARWQQRYFTLDGCLLRYLDKPGGVKKRSFNLSRAKKLCIVDSQPRELELDFGFRTWRLRAESPEVAKRWYLLFQAGQLLGTSADGTPASDHDSSDDDSASTVSSVGTSTAETGSFCEPLTPKFGEGRSSFSLTGTEEKHRKSTQALADRLEIDPKRLDQRLLTCVPELQAENNSAKHTALTSTQVTHGLKQVLNGLWSDISSEHGDSGPSSSLPVAAARAVESLKQMVARSGPPDPEAFREALEGCLGEYLLRLRQSLEHWIQRCDPSAKEVADVATWLFSEAGPSFRLFELGAAELSVSSVQFSVTYKALENMLLTEWETRSCDEAFMELEQVFESYRHSPKAEGRANKAVSLLQDALAQRSNWQHHADAVERSTSVLLATLNVVLRSFRKATSPLLLDSSSAQRSKSSGPARLTRAFQKLGQNAIYELQKASACSESRTAAVLSPRRQTDLQIAVSAFLDCCQLASFCKKASAQLDNNIGSTKKSTSLCSELLSVFADTFTTDASALSWIIVKTHFEPQYQRLLQAVGRGRLHSAGMLSTTITVARSFVTDILASTHDGNAPKAAAQGDQLAKQLLFGAITRFLASLWARRFSKQIVRLSPSLLEAIASDRAALQALVESDNLEVATNFENECGFASPVEPLCIVERVLTSRSLLSLEQLAESEKRLVSLLGKKTGTELNSALHLLLR